MKKAFIITVSILSSVIIALSIYVFHTSTSLTATTASLENLYQRSFYELVNNVNNMEVEVSKLMVSNDSTSQQKILSNLKQQTSDAESSLSLLPVNNEVLEETTQFMNKLNGFCSSLITYKNGKISGKDYETLAKVHKSIEIVKTELNEIIDKIMKGYRISNNISAGVEEGSFSSNFAKFNNETMEFPSLIYDGPFSDSTTNKVVKGLKGKDITEEEAEKIVQGLFKKDDISGLNYLGETKAIFNTYDYGINVKDKNYYVQITKKGGFLLTMNSNVKNNLDSKNETVKDSKENSVTLQDKVSKDSLENKNKQMLNAIEKAEIFAKNLNLKNMKNVWSASSEKICYVNLAPIEEGIVMYPDLIKVKVDLNTNKVVGWEATSYAYNHIEREDLVPTLSESDAKKLVSNNLSIKEQKLCVIPLDFVGETLAYEFSGEFDNYNYYLYIDAYTGNQVRVLRVIQTEEGELVM